VPAEVGIARVRKGLYGLAMEESPMFKMIEDTFYEHEKCGLVNIVYLDFTVPFLALQKNSQFREIMRVK
jgi:hypothetical protein